MTSPIVFINVTEKIASGLSYEQGKVLAEAYDYVTGIYDDKTLPLGLPLIELARGACIILAMLNTCLASRIAALLVPLPETSPREWEGIEGRYGSEVVGLVENVQRLLKLDEVGGGLMQQQAQGKNAAQYRKEQAETLRKMMLAMASDMRVVLIRLAVRMAALRFVAKTEEPTEANRLYAQETLELYAPLANRLGIWQMKWELEDLSFWLLDAEAYKSIAKMLEDNREEREDFITNAIEFVRKELQAIGISADVSGRPKHIYSIWNKMHAKSLDFSEMTDVRAMRIIVSDIKECFSVLDVVHRLWTPILDAFDDYISRPKANGYRSLHTIVIPEDGMPLEVQIRTEEMHHFAEYGVAAHWRYKETGGSDYAAQRQYDEKLSWLRQVLAWQTDAVWYGAEKDDAHKDWVKKIKETKLDDRIYVLTPRARVIELPKGATPIDFAYQVHTQVGHRCRGARVDGALVSLNTPLKSGQTVEIITAKSIDAGPSRDWLTPAFAVSARTQSKIRAWFNAIEHEETIASGRNAVDRILQREGKTALNLDELAMRLGFSRLEEFYLAVGRDKISARSVEQALYPEIPDREEKAPDVVLPRKSRATSIMRGAQTGILVMGTEGMLTQLAKCCKPAPPDKIAGFVTRGKGVSIHRPNCKNFKEMKKRSPDRVMETSWGSADQETVYPVEIYVLANDRRGLLRDISDVFLREKHHVVGVNTKSNKEQASMTFVVEVTSSSSLNRSLGMLMEVPGVMVARRV